MEAITNTLGLNWQGLLWHIANFAVLLILLTLLTVSVSFFPLSGIWHIVIGLSIAACKATLVVLFFMHVKYSSGLTRIVVVAGFFWLAILLALTLSDFFTRAWTPIPSGWQSSISQYKP